MRLLAYLLFTVLLCGCISSNDGSNEKALEQPTSTIEKTPGIAASDCDLILNKSIKDTCYTFTGIRSRDAKLCNKAVSKDSRNYCYELVGILLNDTTICDRIQEDRYKWDQCYKKVGVALKDTTLCDRIQENSTKRFCYADLAILRSDIKLAEKEQMDTYVYYTIAIALNDSTICDGLAAGEKENCYLNAAVGLKDKRLCERIQDNSAYDSCLKSLAIRLGDCDKISNELQKNNCNAQLAKTLKNATVCDNISTNRDSCYVDVAIALNDTKICSKIQNTSYLEKQKCLGEIAVSIKEVRLIDKSDYMRDTYYNKIAEALGDYAVCSGKSTKDSQDYCYHLVAKSLNDTTVCDKITNPEEGYSCYLDIGVTMKNTSICDKIEDNDRKHLCDSLSRYDDINWYQYYF